MKKLILITIFLLIGASTFAQWNCFTPGTNQFFTNNYGYVRGMRIDSITGSGGNQVYHPFKTVRMTYQEYLVDGIDVDSNGGSWLGEFVRSTTDGSFLFDNIWGDTVLIKTQAGIGDSWIFYNDNSNDHYIATVTAVDTMSVLGIPDSIKRITLTAYQNGIYSPTDSFDNTELILSRSNGFVQAIDLYNFPYHRPDSAFNENDIDFVFQRSLVDPSYYINHNQSFTNYVPYPNTDTPGKYNSVFTRINFADLNMAQIGGGWNVGDVMHTTRCWVSNPNCISHEVNRFMDTIISKNVTLNGVEYHYSGEFANRINFNQYVFYPDAGTIFYSANEFVLGGKMPEEIRFDTSQWGNHPSWFYYYYPNDTSYCTTGALYHKVSANLEHLGWIGIFGYVAIKTYKEGLGVTRGYDYHYDGLTGEINDSTIKFFLRNGDSCGSSFTFPGTTSVNTIISESSIRTYPNPAYTELTIESPLPGYAMSLINTVGQVVYSKLYCNPKEQIEVQGLAPGVYYLRLELTGKQPVNKKVLVQR